LALSFYLSWEHITQLNSIFENESLKAVYLFSEFEQLYQNFASNWQNYKIQDVRITKSEHLPVLGSLVITKKYPFDAQRYCVR